MSKTHKTVRIPNDLMEAMENKAKEWDMSDSDLIRQAVVAYIDPASVGAARHLAAVRAELAAVDLGAKLIKLGSDANLLCGRVGDLLRDVARLSEQIPS